MAAKDEQSKEKKTAEEKPAGKSGKKRLIIIGGISVLIVAIAAVSVGIPVHARGSGDEDERGSRDRQKNRSGRRQENSLPSIRSNLLSSTFTTERNCVI